MTNVRVYLCEEHAQECAQWLTELECAYQECCMVEDCVEEVTTSGLVSLEPALVQEIKFK